MEWVLKHEFEVEQSAKNLILRSIVTGILTKVAAIRTTGHFATEIYSFLSHHTYSEVQRH